MSRLGCLFVLVPMAALAHDADVIYARLERSSQGTLAEHLTLTAQSLGLLAPIDRDRDGLLTQAELDEGHDALSAGVWDDVPLTASGRPCVRTDERALLDDGFVSLTARFSCAAEGPLRQDFKVLRILPPNYRVVLGSQLDGERGKRFAQGVFTALEVPRPSTTGPLDGPVLERGLRRGLAELGRFDGLGALFLVFLTAGTARWLFARLAIVSVAGPAFAAAPFIPPAASVILLGIGLTFVLLKGRAVGLIGAALITVALVGRTTGVEAGPWVGAWLALLSIALVTSALAFPLGRIVARRPEVASVVRAGLALSVAATAIGRLVR